MATKNIARSALEGGRHSYNKWDRRQSNAEERAQARDYIKRVMADPESADDDQFDARRPVYKEFTDKLSPMYRWLEKQVGRSWADVRSEVFDKFDIRTTAGRHIIFDHLLGQVVDTKSGFDRRGNMANPDIEVVHNRSKYYRGSYADYYVDENGILCEHPDSYRKNKNKYKYERVSEQDLVNIAYWLKGNIIGEKGGKLYWFVPTDGIWMASWIEPYNRPPFPGNNKLKYYLLDNGPYKTIHYFTWETTPNGWNWTGMSHGDHWEPIDNPFSFRQRAELSKEEREIFFGLPERIRNEILVFGKGR